jgi:hypothetical protein
MARKMRLTLGDESGVVELYEEKAPKTVDAIWNEVLPWDSASTQHARFSGHEFWCDAPLVLEEEENMNYEVSTGEVGYFYFLPAIVCWYDDVEVITPGNVFGQVTENLEGIQQNAHRTWFENDIPMKLEKMED